MVEKQQTAMEQFALLSLINDAKDLISSGASSEKREEFIQNLSVKALGAEKSEILTNYVDLVKDVLNPNTESALRADALETLGMIVYDKMNIEKLEASEGPGAQSTLKALSALKGLYGVVNLVQHNVDMHDSTKLQDDAIRKIGLNLLKEFSLQDSVFDFARESKELLESGARLYDVLSENPMNPFKLAMEAQMFVKEGVDVIRQVKKSIPEIKQALKDIVEGTKSIIEHIKERINELDEIWDDFCDDIALVKAQYNAEILENKLEAYDGDGEDDGMFNEMVANTNSFFKAIGKGVEEFGEFVGDVLIFGHDDDEEEDLEILPTFEGVEKKEMHTDPEELKDWAKEADLDVAG